MSKRVKARARRRWIALKAEHKKWGSVPYLKGFANPKDIPILEKNRLEDKAQRIKYYREKKQTNKKKRENRREAAVRRSFQACVASARKTKTLLYDLGQSKHPRRQN